MADKYKDRAAQTQSSSSSGELVEECGFAWKWWVRSKARSLAPAKCNVAEIVPGTFSDNSLCATAVPRTGHNRECGPAYA